MVSPRNLSHPIGRVGGPARPWSELLAAASWDFALGITLNQKLRAKRRPKGRQRVRAKRRVRQSKSKAKQRPNDDDEEDADA